MGQKFAAYSAQGLIIAYYDSDDSPAPDGATVIEITDAQWQTCINNPGWTVKGGVLIGPVPPTAAELTALALIQSAQQALESGLTISSTSTPMINGTYAVDQLSQSDVIAIETGLNAGKGFPGGVTSFNYPDAAGALHAFTAASFTDFAEAVRDFVYGCKSVIAGQSPTLPTASVTIA